MTVCNWAAQKQSRSQTDWSILPIYINTHGQYTTPTCPKCAYKTSQIFSQVFEFALAEFCAKFTKINVPQILPLLQYMHMYHSPTLKVYNRKQRWHKVPWSQISWNLQLPYELTDNCTKIPDWTIKYGINCCLGFNEGTLMSYFPFSPIFFTIFWSIIFI